MKHYGDITKINGAEVEPVWIITGGSPCQDLSVAGKRAGLAGERSGLFMEQIRIIKEMRENDKRKGRAGKDVRCRFMVWENVPGAFSSNKGEDFRAVLEETARVADKDAVIPGPPKGKWTPAGCIMGDGWSIAWRVHDAQHWGVPQRRKRIALVADFGGNTAPEILFERKGVSGDTSQSREQRESAASDAERGTGKTIGFNRERCGAVAMNDAMPTLQAATGESGNNQSMVALSFQERAGKPGGGKGILIQDEHTGALSTLNNQNVCYGIGAYNSEGMKSDNPHAGIYEADTARTLDLNGGNPACNQGGMAVVGTYDVRISSNGTKNWRAHCYETDISRALDTKGENPDSNHGGVAIIQGDERNYVLVENHPADSRCNIAKDGIVQTLSSRMGTGGGNVPMVMEPITASKASYFTNCHNDGKAETLVATDYKDPQVVAYGLDRASFNQGENAKYDFSIEEEKIGAQVARGPGAVCQSVVRCLTPLECERLQGFPDGWTDIGDWVDSKGKKHKGESDSPRYKALGNSIALPFWEWMAGRMVDILKDDGVEQPTMASLFDGIGGFPLVHSRCGCKPIWASEIEEFPIAVTQIRFPEEVEE